jgi:hypothetical protein
MKERENEKRQPKYTYLKLGYKDRDTQGYPASTGKQLRVRITLLHLDPMCPYCHMNSEIVSLVENVKDLVLRQ